ncbi:MAG: biopolymer transporter ExbD [Pseudomonadota bacterium]|nr:biopolymer transporter ExbD [Pseudomonadota bacterium]
MGAKVGGKKGGAMADINVTPLVDVVLVLLIIFMVVTPMLSSGVDVDLPKAKTAEEEKDMGQHLVISVKGDGTVYVDRTQVALDDLAQLVDKERANRPMLLKGDQTATYKQVRDVMDKLHELPGTDTMLLAAEKLKE